MTRRAEESDIDRGVGKVPPPLIVIALSFGRAARPLRAKEIDES